MAVQDSIREKLIGALSPSELIIEDQSHLHKGHAGHKPGGESHFHLRIVSEAFQGRGRVERHRMVTAALSELMGNPIHALSMKTMTQAEALND